MTGNAARTARRRNIVGETEKKGYRTYKKTA